MVEVVTSKFKARGLLTEYRGFGRVVLCCALSAGIVGARAFAQNAPTGYSLTVTVTNSVTGEPVARALVELHSFNVQNSSGEPGPGAASSLTDNNGLFRLDGLVAADWQILIRRPDFENWHADNVAMGPDAPAPDLRVALRPLTVITGRVTDSDGDPVEGVQVQALRAQEMNSAGQQELIAAVKTDDRGRYRLAGLSGGPFYVRVTNRIEPQRQAASSELHRDQAESFLPLYYPGTEDAASASAIPESPDQEFEADFVLHMQRAFTVRGTAAGYAQDRPTKIELLHGEDDVADGRASFNAATGRFEIRDVVAGAYLLRFTQALGTRRAMAEAPLEVTSADVNGLVARFMAGVDIECHIQAGSANGLVDDDAGEPLADAPPLMARIELEPEYSPAGSTRLSAVPVSDGEMRIPDVLAGKYRVIVHPFYGYAASVESGGTDLLQNPELTVLPGAAAPPIEITIAYDGGSVSGKVLAGNQPATANVMLVPKAGSAEAPEPVVATDGQFSFHQVPPGSYVAYAWTGQPGAELSGPPAFERAGIEGVPLEVERNAQENIELTVSGGQAQ